MEKVVDNISKPKIQYKYRVDFRRNNNEY